MTFSKKLERSSCVGSPGDACSTKNRQHDAGEEIAFEASASHALRNRQDAQGYARGESDRLGPPLLQPRLNTSLLFIPASGPSHDRRSLAAFSMAAPPRFGKRTGPVVLEASCRHYRGVR